MIEGKEEKSFNDSLSWIQAPVGKRQPTPPPLSLAVLTEVR